MPRFNYGTAARLTPFFCFYISVAGVPPPLPSIFLRSCLPVMPEAVYRSLGWKLLFGFEFGFGVEVCLDFSMLIVGEIQK